MKNQKNAKYRTLILPFFLWLFGAIFPSCLVAQDSVLDNYVKEGITKNIQLQKEQLNLEQGLLNVAIAKAKMRPVVSFDASYLLARGGRSIDVPIGDLLNPVNATLNQLSGEVLLPTNLENAQEYLIPNNFHDTRIKAKYPIYNRPIYFNYKAQEQLLSVQEAKMEAYKTELKKEIKIAYYNYFKTYKILAVFDSTEKFLKELLVFNQKLIKYGKATEYITASVEYEIEKINSARADVNQKQMAAKAYFNVLLNRDLEAEIIIDPVLEEQTSQTFYFDFPALNQLQQTASANRAELKQVQQGLKVNETITELNRKSLLPTLGVELNTGFQGRGYHFDNDQAFVNLGLGMSWTLYDGKQRKLKIQQTEIETSKLQLDLAQISQQIKLQVNTAYHQMEATTQKLKAAQASMRNANKSFSLIRKQYENEQALLIEYLDARTKLTNASIAVSIARFDLLIRKAELERAANL